jgi:catechol 2,3-dioxygenase-like lactoylglutathione lyase family enzyme
MALRLDNVGIVVEDLAAAIEFFRELGLELEGRGLVEGEWAGRVTGLGDQRVEIAMMRTPDGYGRLELSRFFAPEVVADHRNAPVNALGYLRVMFAVDDIDDTRLVAIGYELHESRGKTDNSRRRFDLDATTIAVLQGWRSLQTAEYDAIGITDPGWVFADNEGHQVHSHAISQAFERIARRAGVPVIRLHDLRHTHGTLLIKAGIPVKVVSERLGHANIAFTIETYQHVLPGMQREAAHTFEALVAAGAVPPVARSRHSGRENVRENTAGHR